jgi:hypothetical protein
MNAPTKTPPPRAILLREDAGKIAIIDAHRPAARNSLSEALLTACRNPCRHREGP